MDYRRGMNLVTRTCDSGCGITFRVLPTSEQFTARADCLNVCKGVKRTKAQVRAAAQAGEAMGSWRNANTFQDVLQNKTQGEVNMARRNGGAALAVADDAEEPKWLTNWNAVVEAAAEIKGNGGDMSITSILDRAGVDEKDWYAAVAKAKREIYEKAKAFYEDVLERKMREPGVRSVNKRQQESTEQDDTEETVEGDADVSTDTEEEAEAPPTVGDVMSGIVTWLEPFDQETQYRILKAACILLDIDVAEILAGAVKAPLPARQGRPPKKKGGRR